MNRVQEGLLGKGPVAWPAAVLTTVLLVGCGGGDGSQGVIGKTGTGFPVSVQGTVRYEDRTFDETGFTGKNLRPVRAARIEIIREADGEVLVSGATGLDGTYDLTLTNDGPAGVYVSVLAQESETAVTVQDKTGNLYAIRSKQLDDTESDAFTVDLTATVGALGGVFNILDVVLDGASFVRELTGEMPPALTAVWTAGNCDGTYYELAGGTIRILGGCQGDADEYDDTVLLHEYGHFLAARFSRDDSPGGAHFLDDNTQDIRVSWSEGWGNFFPAVVRNDPLYVDTIGNKAAIVFEIESLSSPMSDLSLLPDLAVFTTNELSVAAVLWDIVDDSPGENLVGGPDDVSSGMEPVWDIFSKYLLCPDCGIGRVSFEHFWDGWFAQGHGLGPGMQTLVSDRQMVLMEDAFETDDDMAGAFLLGANDVPEARGIYPEGDVDFFRLAAELGKTYTIETLGLTNGADTFLTLLDSNGVVTDENDNANGIVSNPLCGVIPLVQISNCPPNDDSTLSSRLVLIPGFDATYFLRVDRSVKSPPSAGRYGGYQIRITSE
jgi:hypothetical protein